MEKEHNNGVAAEELKESGRTVNWPAKLSLLIYMEINKSNSATRTETFYNLNEIHLSINKEREQVTLQKAFYNRLLMTFSNHLFLKSVKKEILTKLSVAAELFAVWTL